MPVAGETTHVRHGPADDPIRGLMVSMVRLRSKSCPSVVPTSGARWREAEAVRKTGTFPAGGCGVKDQVSWGAIQSLEVPEVHREQACETAMRCKRSVTSAEDGHPPGPSSVVFTTHSNGD